MNNRGHDKELEEKLQNAANERERIELLIQTAEDYWKQAEYSNCKKYAEKAAYLSQRLEEESHLAWSYYLIGLSDNYLNLYDEALDNHQKALQINKKLGFKRKIAEGLNNIGQVYLNTGDLEKAEQHFRESIQYYPDFARGYNNLGVIHVKRNQFKEALSYMLQGLKLLERDDFPDVYRSKVIALINISEIYMKLDDFDKALKFAHEAQELSENQNDDTRIYGLMNYGALLLELDYFNKAKKYLLDALDLAKKQENREIIKEIYFLLSHTYEQENDPANSLYYLKKHTELEKRIYQESLSKRLAEIQSVYEEENQQLKAQQMIEKASRIATVGAMAAAITHEINQPLCAVKVSADSILYWKKKRGISFPEDIEDSLKTITEAADLINDIVQHVRSFWRPHDEPMEGVAMINLTISKALGLLERQIFSHGIFLDLQLSDEETNVAILPVHLEQIIINIVINAVHALDECSKTTKKIVICSHNEKGNAIITISDNGNGISAELRERIFDPFYTSKANGKGMGLGLAIVDNYLRKYHGRISVIENEEGGATFKIELPGA